MENKISKQQLLAKKYLEENEIEKIVSEMINSLVHESSKTPIIYMIKYLAGLLTDDERKANNLVIPEPYPKGKPIVKFPVLPEKSNSLLKKHLTKSTWAQIKYNRSKFNGTVMDLIRLGELEASHKIGVCLTDSDCLDEFSNLLDPIMQESHDLNDKVNSTVIKHNYLIRKSKIVEEKDDNFSFYNFPFQSNIVGSIKNIRIEISRNLEDYPFSNIISKEKRESVLKQIKGAITTLSQDEPLLKKGKLLNVDEDVLIEVLKDMDIDYENMNNYMITGNMKTSWPDSRAIFVSENKELLILINFVDHIKIVFNVNFVSDFFECFERAYYLIKCFERVLNFEVNKNYGYVNSCPSLTGAGIEIFLSLSVQNMKNPKLEKLINKLNFDYYNFDTIRNLLKLNMKFKLIHSSELNFIKTFYNKISTLALIDDNKLESMNLDKKEFDNQNSEAQKIYAASYDSYENSISPAGSNINSLLCISKSVEEKYGSFLFKEVCDVLFFKKLLFNLFKISRNIDIQKEIGVNEEDSKFSEITNPSKVQIKVVIIRNLDCHHFTCSKFCDNNQVLMKIKNYLDNQQILSNIDMVDANEYINVLNSAESNNENESLLKSIISINNAVTKNKSDFSISSASQIIAQSVKFDLTSRKIIKFDYKDFKDILVYVNDIDHFRLEYVLPLASSNNLKKVLKLLGEISQGISFAYDNNLGFYGPLPKSYGTGISLTLNFNLDNFNANFNLFNDLSLKYPYTIVNPVDQYNFSLVSLQAIGISPLMQMKEAIEMINTFCELDVSLGNKEIAEEKSEVENPIESEAKEEDKLVKEDSQSELSNMKSD